MFPIPELGGGNKRVTRACSADQAGQIAELQVQYETSLFLWIIFIHKNKFCFKIL